MRVRLQRLPWTLLFIQFSIFILPANAAVNASAPKDLSVTFYDNGLGIVTENRDVELSEGKNSVLVEGISSSIQPASVTVRSLTSPGNFVIREQVNKDTDLDSEKVLSNSVGKEIRLKTYLPNGESKELSGRLLHASLQSASTEANADLVVQSGDKIIISPKGEIELDALPPNLALKPSLLWTAVAKKGGHETLQLSYCTTGLSWTADYSLVLSDDQTKADLTSWVTIDNNTDVVFRDATINLMAGQPHLPRPHGVRQMFANAPRAATMDTEGQSVEEQSFADYHLYSFRERTDINEKEKKQLNYLSANALLVKKNYVLENKERIIPFQPAVDMPEKVQIKLQVQNTEKSNLGMPLPAGAIRVFKRDSNQVL
jgi:hypothetical protein